MSTLVCPCGARWKILRGVGGDVVAACPVCIESGRATREWIEKRGDVIWLRSRYGWVLGTERRRALPGLLAAAGSRLVLRPSAGAGAAPADGPVSGR